MPQGTALWDLSVHAQRHTRVPLDILDGDSYDPVMLTRIAAATFFAIAPVALAQSLAGLWDATVKVNDLDVPFRIELSGQGSSIKGTFFNGDERFTSSGGRF